MLSLLANLGLLVSAAASGTTSIEAKSRLTETVRTSPSGHSEVSWTRTETRLHLLVDPRRPHGTPGSRFLLREDSFLSWDDASEGVTSKLTVQRLDRTRTGYDSVVWSVNVPSQSASFFDGMLQTLRFGCCDQEDEYRYYAPSTDVCWRSPPTTRFRCTANLGPCTSGSAPHPGDPTDRPDGRAS